MSVAKVRILAISHLGTLTHVHILGKGLPTSHFAHIRMLRCAINRRRLRNTPESVICFLSRPTICAKALFCFVAASRLSIRMCEDCSCLHRTPGRVHHCSMNTSQQPCWHACPCSVHAEYTCRCRVHARACAPALASISCYQS